MTTRTYLVSILLAAVPAIAVAQTIPAPALLSYQGKLTQTNGQPVPDGSYSVRFSLWPAASAGVERWNQTLSVQTTGGVFGAILTVSAPADLFNENLWMEVKVGAAAALPRQQLTSVPYALKANTVPDGSITAAKLAPGVGGSGWGLAGNAGTNSSTQFVGTTDNQAVAIRANNRQVMRYEDMADAGNTYHTVNVLGGAAINTIASGVIGATIAGGGQDMNTGLDVSNDIAGSFGVIGGGSGNSIDAFTFATIAGGSGNVAQGNHSSIGGGSANNTQSDNTTIGGGSGNYVFGAASTISGGINNSTNGNESAIGGGNGNTASDSGSTIGGGQSNSVSGYYATIAGGFQNANTAGYGALGGGAQNEVAGFLATLAGGSQNKATGQFSSVGGGSVNAADADNATIAGGDQNTVKGTFSSVGGGKLNYGWSVSDFGAIGGGYSNAVFGDYACVPGGYMNFAGGLASLAAGYRAYASHAGSFVWSDIHDANFASVAANEFCIRAQGGIVVESYGNVPFYTGVGTTELNRYVALLNSPLAPSASGLMAGGILCADAFNYATPAKNNMVVKGTLGVGYPNPSPYTFAVNGSTYSLNGYSGSDARWKKNIEPLPHALDDIARLRGVTFDWRKDEFPDQHFGDGKQIGLIAQEVESVLPELVSTDGHGYKSVAYDRLVPVLVEAVKDLRGQVQALTAENAGLKEENDRIARLEVQVAALAVPR